MASLPLVDVKSSYWPGLRIYLVDSGHLRSRFPNASPASKAARQPGERSAHRSYHCRDQFEHLFSGCALVDRLAACVAVRGSGSEKFTIDNSHYHLIYFLA